MGGSANAVSRCFMVCSSGTVESVLGGAATFNKQVLICVALTRSLCQRRYGADRERYAAVSCMAFILHIPDTMFASIFQIVCAVNRKCFIKQASRMLTVLPHPDRLSLSLQKILCPLRVLEPPFVSLYPERKPWRIKQPMRWQNGQGYRFNCS